MQNFIQNALFRDPESPLQESAVYSLFRIAFALMFFSHGAQKILGAFGGVDRNGATAPFGSMFFWAGIIELVVGTLLTLGIFTRPFALLAVIEMFFAYFIAHVSKGFFPIQNGGTLVVLYFFGFLLIFFGGSGRWSLGKTLWGSK